MNNLTALVGFFSVNDTDCCYFFKQLELLSFFIVELCLVEYDMLKYPPSLLAAAAIYTAQCTISGTKQWSKTNEYYTSYSEEQLG